MIVLRVLSYNGVPANGPAAQFDEIGGTIGRADNNQLVLPDPERTISRIHARLVFRGGGYAVVDNGSNPISVNGQPVGSGREQPLRPGDLLQIGGYVLEAAATPAGAGEDSISGLFGSAPLGLAVPAASAPASASARAAPQAPGSAWPAPAAAAPKPAPAPTAALAPGHIPDDWDPFAPAAPGPAPAPADDAFAGLSRGGGESLDELFGLASAPKGGDPLAAAPAERGRPDTARQAETAQPLMRTATVMPPTRSDHASELNTPMVLPPAAAPARPPPAKTAPAKPAPPQPAQLPAGAVFSWNEPGSDGRVVTLPGRPRSQSAAAAVETEPMPLAPAAPPSRPPVPSPQAPRAPAPAASRDAELLAGLLQGLAVPGLRLAALTPETMRLVGQLLRESVRGAVELLVARAALKREMRTEVTVIASSENNPLKFSPNVEVALQHLLSPPASGFMAATPALRDAFDDLRAHQLGVMAGMRAALDGVLQRFDPQQLEGKLTRKSAIASLIPATRKARLWELFQELFTQLQSEAQDDFDELFGKAFRRAYEDQLERLRREQ